MDRAVIGIVREEEAAVRIFGRLQAAGFSGRDVSVLVPDRGGRRDFAYEQHTKAPEGAAAGGASGALLGGLAGWLVGIGSLAIPGLGPFVAAGPLMAALSGAAAGAAAGGITGALLGMGMPEYEARQYEGKLREGGALVSVHTSNREQRALAKEIFESEGATNVRTTGESEVDDEEKAEPRTRRSPR